MQSNWSRHELKADLRGSYTGYSPDETPTLSRPYFNGKVDGRIDVTRDTHIDLGSRVLVSTDNPGSPNLQAGLAKLPVFATFGGSAGIGSASTASICRRRATSSAPPIRTRSSPTARRRATRTATTINMAAPCAAATS